MSPSDFIDKRRVHGKIREILMIRGKIMLICDLEWQAIQMSQSGRS